MTEKIIGRLKEIKSNLQELKNKNYTEGEDDYGYFQQLLDRIVDRTYPETEAKKVKGLHHTITVSIEKSPAEKQKEYVEDIINSIKLIDTILEEYELFGFEDFQPVKEKTEKTFGLDKGKPSFLWKQSKG